MQLCVLRYPGRLLVPGEFVPPAGVDFIGRQLDPAWEALPFPTTKVRRAGARGVDGASATALQPPRHLLTTLPAPAGGGRRVCHGAGESGWRGVSSPQVIAKTGGHSWSRRALSCGFAVRIFEDRIPTRARSG